MALGTDITNDVSNNPFAIDHNGAMVRTKFFHAVFHTLSFTIPILASGKSKSAAASPTLSIESHYTCRWQNFTSNTKEPLIKSNASREGLNQWFPMPNRKAN